MGMTIWGTVVQVVDAETFDLHVSDVPVGEVADFAGVERVRLADAGPRRGAGAASDLARAFLHTRIMGKRVEVDVLARDRDHHLVGSISAIKDP